MFFVVKDPETSTLKFVYVVELTHEMSMLAVSLGSGVGVGVGVVVGFGLGVGVGEGVVVGGIVGVGVGLGVGVDIGIGLGVGGFQTGGGCCVRTGGVGKSSLCIKG